MMLRKTAAVWVILAAWATAGLAADDAKPEGTWKWSVERNGEKIETTLKLKMEGDKLTGTITGRDGKETAIEEASCKDGEVKFQITRERNGEKVVVKYSGKIDKDTITGKSEAGDRSRDWKAERSK
ncbi:MAG: hypothetical protein HY293_03760 [Planctomycetes bacterium]|nr:hypothetical protein [Planctomycetota bacterium]